MCKEHTRTTWTEDELRLGILQVIYGALQKTPNGGASAKLLIDCLDAAMPSMEHTLFWLREQQFIEAGERVFLITSKGIDYLIEGLGPDPSDPSRVPRRPHPESGDSSIALPIPQKEGTGGT